MSFGGSSVLVTGANRGIGLEFVRQLVLSPTPPKYVFATFRNKEVIQELEQIKDSSNICQLIPIEADVTKPEDIRSIRERVDSVVGDAGLNLLINNAAVLRYNGFPEVSRDDMLAHFETNVVGPFQLLQELLPLLQKAASSSKDTTTMGISRAAVLNISAMGGSILDVEKYPREFLKAVSYRISKASLNMAMRVAAVTLRDQGILVVNMCPGWVKTDMGTEKAPIEVTDSVSAMLGTVQTLGDSHQGGFMDRHGETIPF